MTLSTVIYQIHQQTKDLTSVLTRSQIYELVASLYGFDSQKLFRQKSIAINGNFPSISLNRTSFLKRCSKLHLSEFNESLYKIISEEIMRSEICIIGLDIFIAKSRGSQTFSACGAIIYTPRRTVWERRA